MKPTGAGVRQREDEGQGSKKGQKKRRVEKEFEEFEKLPEYHTGDVVYTTCHKKCKSSNALKLHIEIFHKGDFLYTCNECGKGINTQECITAHKMAQSLMQRDGLAQGVVMLLLALRRPRLIMLSKSIVDKHRGLLVNFV